MANNIKIIKYNIKILNISFRVFAIVYTIIIIALNNTWFLTTREAAFIVQFLLAPLGIILFSDIASLEHETDINELVLTKKISFYMLVLIRFIISLVYLTLIEFLIISLFNYRGGTFFFGELLLSGITTSITLGTISLVISYISKNKLSGMTIAFMYYILEFITKGKYTKSFYLLSYTTGNIEPIYKLLIITIITFVTFILYLKLKHK